MNTNFWMILAFTLATLTSTPAFAGDACEQYEDDNDVYLHCRAAASRDKLREDLGSVKSALEYLDEEREEISDRVARLESGQTERQPTQNGRTTLAQPYAYGAIPMAQQPMPGEDAAATDPDHMVGIRSWLEVKYLERGCEEYVGGRSNMIIVEKDGDFLVPIGGRQVYADMDHDGRVDQSPYWAIPCRGSVYVEARSSERVYLHYLVPIGAQPVPGLPLQDIWSSKREEGGQRVLYVHSPRFGPDDKSAGGGFRQ